MSAVKDFLASQRADFISLHELLEAMTQQGDGCSLAEAATALAQVLAAERRTIDWAQYSRLGGITTISSGSGVKAMELLNHVVNTSSFDGDPYDIPF